MAKQARAESGEEREEREQGREPLEGLGSARHPAQHIASHRLTSVVPAEKLSVPKSLLLAHPAHQYS
ncbi:hypothetical protein NDU88_006207 [Pleurodeles waltl]|uniref:Uncharacterized protein n=1 Tax=Pleurodeles waltl TaxID=8319 RepID=A0AAV7TCS8_PLEWA|nr:hypothetical protein NDU88_006207 [Pleurodeles waltl]